mmetsp:Transcript_112566/g.220657  ORF Transcript_112566/g.220657 Transcript_112566/m.220657 type:complete len:513 (-) Transcript_112566:24-1562(-)
MDYIEIAQERLGTTGLAVTSAVTLLFGAIYSYHLHLSIQREGEPPMHWSWLPVLGNAIDLGTRPLEFLSECAKENSEIFGMVVAGNRMFIIADVLSCNTVLKPPKTLTWVEFHDIVLSNFFGAKWTKSSQHGLEFFDEHLMRKWYSNYLLSDSALGALTTRMQVQLAKDIHLSGDKKKTSLYAYVSKLVFQASVASLFTPEAAEDPVLFDAFRAFDEHLPLAAGGYKVDYASGPREARDKLLHAVRKYQSDNNCEFIKKRFTYFDSFGNKENTDSFQLAMLWASVGNTMPSVFWLMYYLMTSPDAMQKVLSEISAVCPASVSGDASFSQDQLNKLLYMDACITETLRLSSGSMIMRHVGQACEVTLASGKTYKFRAGDRVGLCPPLWHMDKTIYSNPTHFDPSRWLLPGWEDCNRQYSEDTVMAAQGKTKLFKDGTPLPSGMGFLPFGGGVTLCPGRRFARNEVKTLVVCLLARFRFELVNGQKQPEFDGARAGLGIFPPKSDIDIVISSLQ